MKNETAAEPLTAIHTQVSAAREGRDPRVIARLFTGWAVFGERQFVRGYALLLPDPVVPDLNSLGARERIAFLSDMSRLGDALLRQRARRASTTRSSATRSRRCTRTSSRATSMNRRRCAARSPGPDDWTAAPAFDRGACQELADGVLRELARLEVTKPMRFNARR